MSFNSAGSPVGFRVRPSAASAGRSSSGLTGAAAGSMSSASASAGSSAANVLPPAIRTACAISVIRTAFVYYMCVR